MMATGARLNSVLDLDLTDLDPSQSQPKVRISVSEETAVGQNDLVLTRVVDLPDECVSAIETYVEYERVSLENAEPPEPLFTSRQGRVTAATVRRSMAAMMDAARTGCGDPSDGETDDDVTSDEGTGDEGDAVRQISPIDIRWYALRQRLNGNN
jgi:site-specific recombinase XerD